MTHDEAIRWLAKIGGSWTEATEQAAPTTRGSIVVSVTSAKGQIVDRRALFDATTEGPERQLEIRRALTRACEELRIALS